MSNTNVTIRMEEGLKNEADIVFSELGMNFTTAVNIFTKQVIRERRIPFIIDADPFYSPRNMAHLREVATDASRGNNMRPHDLIDDDA
ncbi:MAG: type II toxin-antitoxin system RelB/DinJ family antitoxin [Actinomycetaceae bacterium]|nr:type II toxin-antitoxin system RelB/DinJ family antitoxin [Actinomycetaceae bacterium]